MIEEILQQIGLTEGEIKVYLSLLELGSTSTGKIIKKSHVSGSKVYEVLDRLSSKGLVTSVVKNGVKYFEATTPEKILSYLRQKKEDIQKQEQRVQEIIPKLILKTKEANANNVKVFTGFEGLKTANEDIINSLQKGEEWLSMGLTEQPASWERYFTKRQIIRTKKGIIHRQLLNEKYQILYKKRKKLALTYFRFLPQNLEMPTSTEIYKNKTLIFILNSEDPMAILIESKAVADSFRKYFEMLWKQAKK
ncbi:TPA: hypothetical protein HA363_01675 [Candidatus Woesearchaeota archaeon]|nr:hypothetical protein [Candidatus Woesearchaeota archaeon]